jgi:type IV pilus assembly protein PilQ
MEPFTQQHDGYLTTTVTETAAVQTVEYLETGTQLRFRPVINDDGTVQLLVHPKDSNGGLTSANLPFEETTEAQADILLRDGDTILIGGLFRERTVGSRSQVPVLGNIPVAGLLFQSRNDQTVREEVIILLTVHVLKETAQERQQFRELLDNVERVRVGTRVGLLGTGRERLAQAFYHEALRQLDEGDPERALLNVRITLNNQPKHMAAIRLQERLRGERL